MRGCFMLSRRARPLWTFALLGALTLPAPAQSVISTHSGIIHYFEGTVYVGGQPLAVHPGKFDELPQGVELRTAQDGFTEILLTPSVFLRIGERTAIRMVANALSDTRVELLEGSAILDSTEPVAGTSVTLLCKNWKVHFLEEGVYRIEADPPRMWVLGGKAEVAGNDARTLLLDQGMSLPFAPVLVPDQSGSPPNDALSAWADGRQQSISADNAIAENIRDPGSMDISAADVSGFTYFPPLYLPSPGSTTASLYGLPAFNQPGFNSYYLPGYTYLPLLFALKPVGSPPIRHPFYGAHFPTRPVQVFIPIHPSGVMPGVRPVGAPSYSWAHIHTASPATVHMGGGHR